MNSVLFHPWQLHDLTLPNRIVLSPMVLAQRGKGVHGFLGLRTATPQLMAWRRGVTTVRVSNKSNGKPADRGATGDLANSTVGHTGTSTLGEIVSDLSKQGQ
jgi:hypothetical protein